MKINSGHLRAIREGVLPGSMTVMRTMMVTPAGTSSFSVNLHDLALNSIIFSSTFRAITSHDFPHNQ